MENEVDEVTGGNLRHLILISLLALAILLASMSVWLNDALREGIEGMLCDGTDSSCESRPQHSNRM